MFEVAEMTLGIAITIAIYNWICASDFALMTPFNTSAVVSGLVFGILFGDITQGVILGATINLMYISVNYVGGDIPADSLLASCVAIPVAMITGMDVSLAVVLAVPFGILGPFMDNFRRMINTFWVGVCHKYIDRKNFFGIALCSNVFPFLTMFFIRVPIVTAILMLVGDNADKLLAVIPAWLMTALTVLGQILPGMGIMLCAVAIGRFKMLPFLVIGYYIKLLSGMSSLVMCVFAVCIAAIYVMLVYGDKVESDSEYETSVEVEEKENTTMLSDKMLWRMGMRTQLFFRMAFNFRNFYGTGTLYSVLPGLRTIYKDDDDGLKEAMECYMQPFLTMAMFGYSIIGSALAMEEQKAKGAQITREDISTLKSGLMGPFAGFGDSAWNGTVGPILRSIFVPMGLAGNPIAVLGEFIFRYSSFIIGPWMFKMGYKVGHSSLMKILRGGWLELAMTASAVLGMFMLGGMGADNCKISTVLEFTNATTGNVFNIQKILDGVLPGLLPLTVMGFSYWYLNKGKKYLSLMLVMLGVAIVGSLIGFF